MSDEEQAIGRVKEIYNFDNDIFTLIGCCVLAFERTHFLISSILSENDTKKLIEFLGKDSGKLAESVKEEFGEGRYIYMTFDKLRRDRNKIIHAFTLPIAEDYKQERWYMKKNGTLDATVDRKFMEQFINDCFDFIPLRDFEKEIKQIKKEKK
jgi:hypothetical protein